MALCLLVSIDSGRLSSSLSPSNSMVSFDDPKLLLLTSSMLTLMSSYSPLKL